MNDRRKDAASRRATASLRVPAPPSLPAITSEDFLFHLYRGSELAFDGRLEEARAELERAVTLAGGDIKARELLASTSFRLGDYDRACELYEGLRIELPGDTTLALNVSLAYLKTGRTELAKTELERLVALHPMHKRAWGYLGIAKERLGDLAGAKEAFERGEHYTMAGRMAATLGGHKTPADVGLDAGPLDFSLAEPSTESWGVDAWEHGEAPFRDRTSLMAKRPSTLVLGRPVLSRAPPEARSTTLHPGGLPRAREWLQPLRVKAESGSTFTVHPSGLVAARVEAGRSDADEKSIVVRKHALVATAASLTAAPIEKSSRGLPSMEPLGGANHLMVRLRGNGDAVLGPRAGNSLVALELDNEICALREDVLVAFDFRIAHEVIRVVTAEGESTPLVKLQGTGAIVVEFATQPASLPLARSTMHLRKDAVLGWFGALEVRAVEAAEAESGARGLLMFSGEGTLLVTGR